MMKSSAEQAAIEKRLKAAGVRPTAQRIALARFLLNGADHPTAEDVKKWADENFPKMSLATVYNTLALLVRAKLIKEVKLPHTSRVIYDDRVSAHYHFLDEKSGKIYDVDPSEVEVKPRLKKNASVRGVEVLLRGRWESESRQIRERRGKTHVQ
ncbi:MAG: transcriptional repressor [Elusimicrobia bacterium]|nr:transcriptional repressor [Elusimicrobiota bacterium]